MGGDTRFWNFFGGVWLLVGLGFLFGSVGVLVSGVETDEPALLPIFVLVGAAAAVGGAFVILRARRVAARDERLQRSGIRISATVTDIRRSAININRQARWHVCYRYEYPAGHELRGESHALPGEAVEGFTPSDKVAIMVDVRHPEESLFLGAA